MKSKENTNEKKSKLETVKEQIKKMTGGIELIKLAKRIKERRPF